MVLRRRTLALCRRFKLTLFHLTSHKQTFDLIIHARNMQTSARALYELTQHLHAFPPTPPSRCRGQRWPPGRGLAGGRSGGRARSSRPWGWPPDRLPRARPLTTQPPVWLHHAARPEKDTVRGREGKPPRPGRKAAPRRRPSRPETRGRSRAAPGARQRCAPHSPGDRAGLQPGLSCPT